VERFPPKLDRIFLCVQKSLGPRKLYEPIALKDGRKLVTLDDARAFVPKLSARTQLVAIRGRARAEGGTAD
jgi:hypothetical protein